MQKFAKNQEVFGPSNLEVGPNVRTVRSKCLIGTKRVKMQQLDLSFQNAQKRLKFQRTPYLKVRAPSIFHTHASHPSKKISDLKTVCFSLKIQSELFVLFFRDFSSPKLKGRFQSR